LNFVSIIQLFIKITILMYYIF